MYFAAEICTPSAFVLLLHHAVNHGQAVDSHTVKIRGLMLDICGNYVAGHTSSVCNAVYM